jgi:hypothetical protein
LIPNPIHKVLSTLSTHDVRYLLMGGQACVLYGAAEFSRDCDVVILCDAQNLERLREALEELAAVSIAVPPFSAAYLQRGHAVHFRCHAADVAGMRVDVMSNLRGVAPFEQLWSRRTTVEDGAGGRIELMSLLDLIAAKKTQRDKDWPMIRRLVEAHFAVHRAAATDEQISFWLREARSPEILVELATNNPSAAERLAVERPLLHAALSGDRSLLEVDLASEELKERIADREYWKPLKEELEALRRR